MLENQTSSGEQEEDGVRAWASLEHPSEMTTAYRGGIATHLVQQVADVNASLPHLYSPWKYIMVLSSHKSLDDLLPDTKEAV